MKLLARVLCWFLLSSALLAQQDKKQSPPSFPFHISGTVVDAVSGQPLAQAHVMIAPTPQRNWFRSLTADENGHFVFDNVAPGKYTLLAENLGYLAQAYNQHDGYSTAIAVGPDLDPGELIFHLQPECFISGTITDEHNEPVRGAELTLLEKTGLSTPRIRSRSSSDDQGEFRFAHLRPGKYFLIVVAHPWYMQFVHEFRGFGEVADPQNDQAMRTSEEAPPDVVYAPTYYPGSIDAASVSPIVLAPGERFKADMSLQALPAVHIALPVNAGEAAGVSLNLRQNLFGGITESVSFTTRRKEKSLEVGDLAPGHYEMQLNLQPSNGEKMSPASSMEVDIAATGEVKTSEMSTIAKVEGTAITDDGASFTQRCTVNLRNRITGLVLFSEISSQGEFAFPQGVPAGTYEVGILERGFLLGAVKATGAKVAGSTVQVGEGANVTLALTLTKGLGKVDGVALKDGKPFAGAMMVLVPQDPANNLELFRRDQSDSDGTFTLRDALPGKYTVLALEDAWDMQWSDPEVLKSFLAGGVAVEIRAQDKLKIKVNVQVAGEAH
jgi:protocatechuate 3,4-dioxygenase beta subunit